MKFSVITVTLNNLRGLRATLESIRLQRHADLEVIVVDGKSSDGTAQWLASQGDPRVQWLSESDRGLYDAMNKGLERARGHYVVFMNGGDTFADDQVLQKVAEAAAVEPHPDLIYGDAVDVTTSGERLYKRARSHSTLWRGMFTQHQSMFFARGPIGSLRYRLDLRLSGDYDFIARFTRQARSDQGPSVRRLDLPICCFELGGRSDVGRLRALREDFAIRRRTMELRLTTCALLWTAHLIHLLMKRTAPSLMRAIRYEGFREQGTRGG
jgi:putative colanic acid biosynthesis glycosyltransferase